MFRHVALAAAVALSLAETLSADNPNSNGGGRSVEMAANGLRELIIGKWQPSLGFGNGNAMAPTIEFLKGGKLKVTANQFNLDGTYRVIDEHTIEVKLAFGGQDTAVRLTVAIKGGEMKAQEAGQKTSEVLKRVR